MPLTKITEGRDGRRHSSKFYMLGDNPTQQRINAFVDTDPTGELPEEVEIVIEMSGLGFAAHGQQDYHIYGWEDVGRIKAIMRSDDAADMEDLVFMIRPSRGKGGKFALQTDDARLVRRECTKWLRFFGHTQSHEHTKLYDLSQSDVSDEEGMLDDEGLDSETRRDIFEQARPMDGQVGQFIFTEGSHGDRMYVVTNGMLDMLQKQVVIAKLRRGDVFGEQALLDSNHTRTTTVRCRTRSKLLELTRERYHEVRVRHPDFEMALKSTTGRFFKYENTEQRREEKFMLYTLDDPTNWLPEDVGLYVSEAGVQFLQVNEEANTTVVMQSHSWDHITNFKAILSSDDPTDMEIFRISIKGSGNFSFECDDAREVKQEMLYHMFKDEEHEEADEAEYDVDSETEYDARYEGEEAEAMDEIEDDEGFQQVKQQLKRKSVVQQQLQRKQSQGAIVDMSTIVHAQMVAKKAASKGASGKGEGQEEEESESEESESGAETDTDTEGQSNPQSPSKAGARRDDKAKTKTKGKGKAKGKGKGKGKDSARAGELGADGAPAMGPAERAMQQAALARAAEQGDLSQFDVYLVSCPNESLSVSSKTQERMVRDWEGLVLGCTDMTIVLRRPLRNDQIILSLPWRSVTGAVGSKSMDREYGELDIITITLRGGKKLKLQCDDSTRLQSVVMRAKVRQAKIARKALKKDEEAKTKTTMETMQKRVPLPPPARPPPALATKSSATAKQPALTEEEQVVADLSAQLQVAHGGEGGGEDGADGKPKMRRKGDAKVAMKPWQKRKLEREQAAAAEAAAKKAGEDAAAEDEEGEWTAEEWKEWEAQQAQQDAEVASGKRRGDGRLAGESEQAAKERRENVAKAKAKALKHQRDREKRAKKRGGSVNSYGHVTTAAQDKDKDKGDDAGAGDSGSQGGHIAHQRAIASKASSSGSGSGSGSGAAANMDEMLAAQLATQLMEQDQAATASGGGGIDKRKMSAGTLLALQVCQQTMDEDVAKGILSADAANANADAGGSGSGSGSGGGGGGNSGGGGSGSGSGGSGGSGSGGGGNASEALAARLQRESEQQEAKLEDASLALARQLAGDVPAGGGSGSGGGGANDDDEDMDDDMRRVLSFVEPSMFPTRIFEEKRPLPHKISLSIASRKNGRDKFQLVLVFPKDLGKPNRTITKFHYQLKQLVTAMGSESAACESLDVPKDSAKTERKREGWDIFLGCVLNRFEEGRLEHEQTALAALTTFLYDRSKVGGKEGGSPTSGAGGGAGGGAGAGGEEGGSGSGAGEDAGDGKKKLTEKEKEKAKAKAAKEKEKEMKKLAEMDRKLNKKLVQLKNEQEDLLCKMIHVLRKVRKEYSIYRGKRKHDPRFVPEVPLDKERIGDEYYMQTEPGLTFRKYRKQIRSLFKAQAACEKKIISFQGQVSSKLGKDAQDGVLAETGYVSQTQQLQEELNAMDNKCTVCQVNYVHGDKLRIMSCMHQFHMGCIDTWINSGNHKCPTCQKPFCNPAMAHR